MQRGLQHHVARFDNIQHLPLLVGVVHAYQLFVQGDGQRCVAAQFCHVAPPPGTDGLFNAVQGILRQQLQLVQGLVVRERPVGIDAQLQFARSKALADALQQRQLVVESDGAYLQLHTVEALLQLRLDALPHLVERAHPHQSVDGYARLAATERRVEQAAATPQVQQGGLQAEEH